MKECDNRKSHINSKLSTICISSNWLQRRSDKGSTDLQIYFVLMKLLSWK